MTKDLEIYSPKQNEGSLKKNTPKIKIPLDFLIYKLIVENLNNSIGQHLTWAVKYVKGL